MSTGSPRAPPSQTLTRSKTRFTRLARASYHLRRSLHASTSSLSSAHLDLKHLASGLPPLITSVNKMLVKLAFAAIN
jgi:hypothetical protein